MEGEVYKDRPPGLSDEDWDLARRVADAVNLHIDASEMTGRTKPGFVAVRLNDGSSDGVLYDSRADAVRAQGSENYRCAYIKLNPGGMSARQAWVVIYGYRQMYDAGARFHEEEPIIPHRPEILPIIPRVTLPHLRNRLWRPDL